MKIHGILRIKQTSVLFCQYLRKESSELHEILCGCQILSCKLKFGISGRSVNKWECTSCKHACAQVVNMRAHVLSRVRTFMTHALASRYKESVLPHWVPGASHPPKFFFLFYPSKAWITFINAPVCSVNDHPGVINPIN